MARSEDLPVGDGAEGGVEGVGNLRTNGFAVVEALPRRDVVLGVGDDGGMQIEGVEDEIAEGSVEID